MTLVIYDNGDEVLVTTEGNEKEFLAEYGPYRNWEDYERVLPGRFAEISNKTKIRTEAY